MMQGYKQEASSHDTLTRALHRLAVESALPIKGKLKTLAKISPKPPERSRIVEKNLWNQ